MREKLTKKNQSVQKIFKIIEEMARFGEPMRLNDIAYQTNYPNSTILRMLNSLISCGYVTQNDDTLKYSLSIKFSVIGEKVRSQFKIRDLVQPYLVSLSEQYQESSCLAIEDDMSVVYIDTVEGKDNMLRTLQKIGKSAPMHCTGVGKLLLLNYSTKQLEDFVAQKGLIKLTKNTITSFEELRNELDTVRMQGYALDNEECEEGATCLAAPLKDFSGKIIACISVSGPANRFTLNKILEQKHIILETAASISERLGYKTESF